MVSFVDEVRLVLSAGHGGNGCVSVRREKFKPLAGPDGGNGGNGGDIIVIADPQVTTLLAYHGRPHRSSANGQPGMGDYRAGSNGELIELPVPVGTVVKSADGTQLADLDTPGAQIVVAEGGRGGLGNAALATSKRKAPGFALLGTPGFTGEIMLELKTIADVALVGFPSAGKSSLIASMSAARPKIADYPFTTLRPNLGAVQAGNHRFTIADVPGLIEGASAGRGLGIEFLRHIERCTVLLHVLDCATLDSGRDPVTDLETVLKELANYQISDDQVPLLQRPQLVALNKIDVPEAKELADLVAPELEAKGYRVFEISTVSHAGLPALGYALGELVSENRKPVPAEKRIILRPKPLNEIEFKISVEASNTGPIYRVIGTKPERWVMQTDFTNDEAVGFLADRLAKIGVEDELVRAGAVAGSTVVIGKGNGVLFDWEPTLTSAAELISAPRGSDSRLSDQQRATRNQRKASYHDRMDAKAEARAELQREREAGLWGGEDN